jgi:hypothetical protein
MPSTAAKQIAGILVIWVNPEERNYKIAIKEYISYEQIRP